MATIHISEADLARDLHSILAKVQEGVEVIVEQDNRPVAAIRTPTPRPRSILESIAIAKAIGTGATLDEGFMKDVEEGIARRSQPWNPPTWE